MTALAVVSLGIDPGPVPGFFLALWRPGKKRADWARAYQCNADGAEGLLAWILAVHGSLITCGECEEFRPGLGLRGKPSAITTTMGTELTARAADRGVRLTVRHSSQAFPWASDARLKAAGIQSATAQLPHARSASRHALFAACKDGGMSDPLSRRTT